MGVAEAMVASAILAAGSQQVASSKQRSSNRRIAAAKLEQERQMARRKAIASKTEMEQGRRAEAKTNLLASASAQSIRNQQLQQKGIKPRSFKSFGDITRNVLDEGSSVG